MMQASRKALLLLPFLLAQVQLVSSQDSTLAEDLLWSDEFDTNGAPDPSVWSYDLGDGGWGNGEAQVYTSDPSNVNVTDGNLLMTVKKNEVTGEFTSARIKTQGNVLFKYGTVQARIMLPNVADGLWPAFWTLGETYPEVGWPAAGELDIMEVGQGLAITDGLVNNRVVSAAHWQYNGTYATYPAWFDSPEPLNGTYHFFQMDWTPTLISTYVDNNKIWEIDISPEACVDCEEFHQPHFMLLNIAVGGSFTNAGGRRRKLQGSSSSSGCSSSAGGASSSSGDCSPRLPEQVTAPIPATMAVDFLRIFDNGFTEVVAPVASPPTAVPTASPVGQIIAPTAPPSASPVTSTPTAVPTASPIGQRVVATAPPSASPVASTSSAVPSVSNIFRKGTPAPTFSAIARDTSSGKGGKSGKGSSSKGGKSGKGSSSKGGKASKGGKSGKGSSSKGGKASKGNDVSRVSANLGITSAAARSNMAPAATLTFLVTTAIYMVGVIQL
jgi:beta-glucanase (GH16 family)